jgi:hypothetical protein
LEVTCAEKTPCGKDDPADPRFIYFTRRMRSVGFSQIIDGGLDMLFNFRERNPEETSKKSAASVVMGEGWLMRLAVVGKDREVLGG